MLSAGATAAAGDERTRPVAVLVLWLAGLGAAAQYGKVAVVYDMLPALFPGAGPAVGWAVSLVGVVGILLGVVAGVVVARVGLKRAMVVGCAGGALLSALQALQMPLAPFLGLRVVEGAFHLALVVAAPTLILQLSAPRHRGFTLTLWGTFFGVAFAGIAALGVPLAERQGVAALFLAHAAWMAVSAAVLLAVLPADRREAAGRLRLADVVAQTARVYSSARIGAAGWGWLFYTFSFVSFLTLIPPYLPEAVRAATVTAMPLVSIAVSMTVGVLALRYFSAVTVIVAGFLLSAALALALLAAPGSPALSLAVAGALGLVQGASFAAVPELNAPAADRALANGGLAQMGNVGNTFGVPALAFGISVASLAGLLLPLAVVLTGGALVHLSLSRRRRREAAWGGARA